MNYSEKILYLRTKNNLSQDRLAKLLNISNRAVSKWETGISRPSTDNFHKLAKLFGVPLEYFFDAACDSDKQKSQQATGMQSLKELYKIGSGPSSSHTMGPEKACRFFLKKNKNADFFKVILYGSLAKTGIGHGTDRVIKKTFGAIPSCIEFNYTEEDLPHSNTMDILAFKNNAMIDKIRIMSIGGGSIEIEGYKNITPDDIYIHTTFLGVKKYCEDNNLSIWQYILKFEGEEIIEYLMKIWQTMKQSISRGLNSEGILPGGLNVQRKAKYLFSQRHIDESSETRENRMVCSYAFAVSEENACGNTIVTAPTCGASGVVPAVLYYQQLKKGFSDDDIVRALGVGGLIGNLIKTNASISGAECGCQAEIGSACAMASAMLGELFGLDIEQIEYASEIAIEHHLGLTCDPICGLVQIPCIERNAVAAMRAINAVSLANFLSDTRKISLDKVIKTMKETGYALSKEYKETSEGGLAKIWLD
ncbi:MAG: L-serine ammonia-lyase, iron-sulfur-dependent, subunit alpha [Clostridia bacterium]|nr:L-serine ammonia-lyase, iron-sulfur-dependent, subunit alpha [Clostridia bacterium]